METKQWAHEVKLERHCHPHPFDFAQDKGTRRILPSHDTLNLGTDHSPPAQDDSIRNQTSLFVQRDPRLLLAGMPINGVMPDMFNRASIVSLCHARRSVSGIHLSLRHSCGLWQESLLPPVVSRNPSFSPNPPTNKNP